MARYPKPRNRKFLRRWGGPCWFCHGPFVSSDDFVSSSDLEIYCGFKEDIHDHSLNRYQSRRSLQRLQRRQAMIFSSHAFLSSLPGCSNYIDENGVPGVPPQKWFQNIIYLKIKVGTFRFTLLSAVRPNKKSLANIFYLKINSSIFRCFPLHLVWPGVESQEKWWCQKGVDGCQICNLGWLSFSIVFYCSDDPHPKRNHMGLSSIWKSLSAFPDFLALLSGFNPFLARSPKPRKLVLLRCVGLSNIWYNHL